eukprot:g9082.t1
MSRPPTMSMLLKRAGLAKRPRLDRAAPSSKQQQHQIKRKKSTGAAHQADGSREDGGSEGEAERAVRGVGSSGAARGEAVDDQIAALERELQGSSSEGSSSDSSDEESSGSAGSGEDDDNETQATGASTANGREHRRQLKLVSPLETEKIEPLPAHLLPRPGCGMPKANSKKKPKSNKAKGRPKGEGGGAAGPAQSQGLDSAVKELLANYEARSSERVPFYCRVCQFQGESLEDLQRHKEEPLHLEAAKKERKVSTCSLCKKQFTSPPQLKEHLAGKAHLERLQAVMNEPIAQES